MKFFDINKIKKESIVVCIGKRNSGKSFLVKDILYHKKDIPIGTVISHTDHLQHYYDKFIPTMLIHRKYSPDILKKIKDRQTVAIKNEWRDPSAFLLLDDCLSDSQAWNKDETIKEIFYNGRHYKLFFIIAMQAPMGIPPAFRTNIDYTFILKNNNTADKERLYKNYAGVFPTKDMFYQVLDSCTEDYNCLVIDNTTHSNKLEDQIFFYKAKDHGNFRIGNDKLWEKNELYEEDNQSSSYKKNIIKIIKQY